MGSIAIDMKTLTSRQLAVARAIAATLFEADALHPVPRERLDLVLQDLRAYVARVGLQTRLALGAAFFVLQHAPFLLIGKIGRFTRLSGEARRRYLERLERSRFGIVMVLVKTLLCFVYFEHPDALAGTGYDAQGLLGPAWALGAASPISRLRVLESNPSPSEASASEARPTTVAKGA
ncbi:MAG TPA: hypothetical protein VN033_05500 [Vulgatibacter sp.]|nr:hypothetical protein [Vulgatibacter sp.]